MINKSNTNKNIELVPSKLTTRQICEHTKSNVYAIHEQQWGRDRVLEDGPGSPIFGFFVASASSATDALSPIYFTCFGAKACIQKEDNFGGSNVDACPIS